MVSVTLVLSCTENTRSLLPSVLLGCAIRELVDSM